MMISLQNHLDYIFSPSFPKVRDVFKHTVRHGTKYWYKNGQLHRDDDLPAIIHPDKSQEWYREGKKHRDNNLPAVIFVMGYTKIDKSIPIVKQEWWINGHRVDSTEEL